jgi:hypothetical protein
MRQCIEISYNESCMSRSLFVICSKLLKTYGNFKHRITHIIQCCLILMHTTLFIWWVIDCASLIICKKKKPTRCYTVVYWTYNLLNKFRALLCPSSGAQDCKDSISTWHMTPCLRLVAGLVWNEGCSSSYIPYPGRATFCIVLSSWWWA